MIEKMIAEAFDKAPICITICDYHDGSVIIVNPAEEIFDGESALVCWKMAICFIPIEVAQTCIQNYLCGFCIKQMQYGHNMALRDIKLSETDSHKKAFACAVNASTLHHSCTLKS